MVVKIVRLKTEELAYWCLATSADDPGDGDLRVVVADSRRHAAEELECPTVAFLERLSAFARKRLTEERVAVRQRHHAEHDLDRSAAINGHRLAEVELGTARRMRQRHENFSRALLVETDFIAHDGDPAGVFMLLAKPLEDFPAGMPLLAI